MQFPCKKSDDAIGEKRLVFQNPTSAPEKSETVEAEPAANKALEDMTVRELMWKLENDAERTAGLEKQLLDKLEIDTTLEDFYRSHTEAIAPKAEVSIPQGEEKGIGEKAAGVLDQVTEWTRGTMDDVMGYSKTMSPKEKAMEHKKRLVERIRSIKQEERGVTLEDLDNVQKRIETEAAGLVKGGPKFTKENAQFTLIAGAAVGGLLLYRWFTSGSLWESMKSTAWTTAKVGAGFAGVGLAAEAIHRIAGDTEIGKYAAKVSSWYERSVPGLTQYQQAEAAERSMDLRDPGIEYAVEYQNLISLLRDYKSGKSTIFMSSYEKEAEINGQAEIKVQILRTIDRMEKTEPKSSKLVQEQLDAIKTELQSPSPSQDLLDGI
ncbi:MAG: hypothetical protein U1C97_00765, partial [Candidatus Gracilibacteria bacterium]|nr:hypothetical protein [Candidatus Gracilibacteria bacterium]